MIFITFGYRYRKQIAIGILFIILLIGTGIFLYTRDYEEEKVVIEKKVEKNAETQEEYISVDIKGEINSPGIYSMKTSSRVIDVIDKAGGLTENADTTVINLSKRVQDEMVIIIYSKEQVKNFEETKKQEEYLQNKCIQPDENSLRNDACITNNSSSLIGKININTASKEELMNLTGIGESKAKDIISYREKNGNFKSIEEIKNVSGIGENVFAQIKENITV